MKTYLSLKNEQTRRLPPDLQSDDVRYPDALVEHFLREFTQPGDVVFDPFMGFGTTLVVAERLDRAAYGVEYDEKRARYARSLIRCRDRALHGDSTKLADLKLPAIDFSITSPPYMGKHHTENPFTAYSTEGDGYDAYLRTLSDIYRQLRTKLKPGAHAVIEVSNLKHEDGTLTTLAWDIGRAVAEVLTFTGEVIITWEGSYGYGYDHSYCLVFRNDSQA
jgi:DNA modification methylase